MTVGFRINSCHAGRWGGPGGEMIKANINCRFADCTELLTSLFIPRYLSYQQPHIHSHPSLYSQPPSNAPPTTQSEKKGIRHNSNKRNMIASQLVPPPNANPGPAAPLASTWKVRAEAGEPQAVVRVRNLQGVMVAGRDAWGRPAKPQPVLLSSEVSFARPFETASARDALSAETAHYGTLSKMLLAGIELFAPRPSSSKPSEASAGEKTAGPASPRTSDVFEILWVKLTGYVVDGRRAELPLGQLPFLDAARLRSLSLTLHLPKASLLGSGKENPLRLYARCLRLHGLHVPTLIGLNANERGAKQMIVADVEIDRFDAYEDIHTELERVVVGTLEASSFETLEALGAHIANMILDEFRIGDSPQTMRERGWQVKVCLEKPIAVPFSDCPSVEVRLGG
ncbi:Dihydroneopterin aldolase-domain-containing protein [Xylaria intraflava]|nr:Dihydroneopterin aldolase-domain-containing protein [Xylaria intraflava]